MYYCEEGGSINAAVAVVPSQGEDYHDIEWSLVLEDHEVATVHILILSEGMEIDYYAQSAEVIDFPDHSFDVITACQWMKACRGIGASLSESEIANWEQEHVALLKEIAPEEFNILHYGAIAELKKK